MKLTPIQQKVLRNRGMCKVVYKKMLKNNHALGYTAKGGYFYDIHIASDVKPVDIQLITLIHECGHVDLYHMEVKIREELKAIKKIFEQKNVAFEKIRTVGGPVSFLNIAMDLQVNGRYLTPKNIEYMKSNGFELCIPEMFNIVGLLGDFRNYYEPLVDYIASIPEMPSGSPQDSDDSSESESSDNNDNSSSSGSGSSSSKKGKGGKKQKSKKSDEEDSSDENSGAGANEEEDKEDEEEQPYQLPEWAQDLPQDVEDEDENEKSDEELEQEIEKENYKSGNEKAKEDTKEGLDKKETTVDKATDAAEDQEAEQPGTSPKQSYGIGKSAEASNVLGRIVENNNENIREFLSKLIRINYDYLQDPIKHHNRGTRRNDNGLLYNSMRRKLKDTRTKIGILVDVSGSMDASTLLNGLGAFKAAIDVISPESRLVTWNTRLVEEFPILSIPETIRSNGGTEMYYGLEYLVEQGFKTIVLYSDMATDIPPMIDLIKSAGIEMHTIVVDASNGYQNKELEDYLKVNKSFIRVS